MFNHKNTFIGSVIALFLGTSCCWLTTLAAWIGSATLITAIVTVMDKLDLYFMAIGFVLAGTALFLYVRSKGCWTKLAMLK